MNPDNRRIPVDPLKKEIKKLKERVAILEKKTATLPVTRFYKYHHEY